MKEERFTYNTGHVFVSTCVVVVQTAKNIWKGQVMCGWWLGVVSLC